MSNRLGDKIRDLRREKKMTLEELAEATDSSKGYIWELESRDTRKPSAEKLQRIASVLGVTADFLLDDSKNAPDHTVINSAFFRKFEKLDLDTQKILMRIAEELGGKK